LRRFFPSRFCGAKDSSVRKSQECQSGVIPDPEPSKQEVVVTVVSDHRQDIATKINVSVVSDQREDTVTNASSRAEDFLESDSSITDEEAYLDAWRKEDFEFVDREDSVSHPVWFLIDTEWLNAWKAFTTEKGAFPGPIDNNRLVDEFGRLRSDVRVAVDYRGVNFALWDFWQKRYGGGPTIRRPRPPDTNPPRRTRTGETFERSASASRRSTPGKLSAGTLSVASTHGSSQNAPRVTGKNISDPRKASRHRGSSVPAHKVASGMDRPSSRLCCDKCDGPHESDECPFFKKAVKSIKMHGATLANPEEKPTTVAMRQS